MRRLERGANGPVCLSLYHHDTHSWNPTAQEKDAIWQELNAMQNNRCAYCESNISAHNLRHIEHFAARSTHKDYTFRWDNLFGSCNRTESCGTHKDVGGLPYHWTELTKPDVHDPDLYFLFVNDGTIVIRPEINSADQHRARETLRVLNLDAAGGVLRHERKKAIKGPLESYESIYAMWLADPDLLNLDAEMQTLFNEIANLPFCTAIRHSLTSRHKNHVATDV